VRTSLSQAGAEVLLDEGGRIIFTPPGLLRMEKYE
jgi:hypothetical protein